MPTWHTFGPGDVELTALKQFLGPKLITDEVLLDEIKVSYITSVSFWPFFYLIYISKPVNLELSIPLCRCLLP